jgi:PadR family transcriptional regulator, regulatory protein PadR
VTADFHIKASEYLIVHSRCSSLVVVTANHDSQLLKGVLGLVLLRLLSDGESYGYELVTRVHALGLEDVRDGSIYPALTRLEREGHLESRLVPSSSGPARKYYRLSASGEHALARGEQAWRFLVARVEPLFQPARARSVKGARA